jgi:signal transduction histidine kinase
MKTKSASPNKENKLQPLAQLVNRYLSSTLMVALMLILLIFSIGGMKVITWMHQIELDRQVQLLDAEVALYLDNHLVTMSDISALPLITQSVMQPDALLEDVSDFMGKIRLLGEARPLALLDYRGSNIHGVYIDEIFRKQLMNNLQEDQADSVVKLITLNSTPVILLGVPILFNGLVEGALASMVPLEDMLSTLGRGANLDEMLIQIVQDQAVVESIGSPVNSVFFGHIFSKSLQAEIHLKDKISHLKRAWIIGFFSVGIMVILIVVGFTAITRRMCRHTLLKPINQLREDARKAGEKGIYRPVNMTNTPIRELVEMGEDFNEMLLRIEAREASLLSVQNELKEAHRRLKIWDEAKRQWVGNLGHELRTPLSGLISVCDSIFYMSGQEIDFDDLKDEYKKTKSTIEKLLNDASLLTFMDVSSETFKLEPTELGVVIAGTMDEMEGRQVKVVKQASTEDMEYSLVYVEPALLQRAFTDICCTIACCIDVGTSIELISEGDEERIVLLLSAFGKSLSNQEIELFFEVGGQRDTFKAGEEFGLGAHLAGRIIKLFGGDAQVYYEKGKITVEISLPRVLK